MARVIVTHTAYGCDSGCCGHVVEVDGDRVGEFSFVHPNLYGKKGEAREHTVHEFVRDIVTDALGAEHCADIDWDNCIVLDD